MAKAQSKQIERLNLIFFRRTMYTVVLLVCILFNFKMIGFDHMYICLFIFAILFVLFWMMIVSLIQIYKTIHKLETKKKL